MVTRIIKFLKNPQVGKARKLLIFTLFFTLLAIIITSAIITAIAVNNAGSSPVSWWKFDEGYGSTAYDASGSNDGTITNALWKNEPDCKSGKCLYFDGSGDYATVSSANNLNPTEGLTIEGWVKPNTYNSTSSTLFSKGSQYTLSIDQGLPKFQAYANSTWHSVKYPGTYTGLTFREGFDNHLSGDSGAAFTANFGFRNLTGGTAPANLAAKLGVLITQSDNLQYTRGSLQGGNGAGVVYENFDPNQGTLEFWVRPNWNGNDGVAHEIFYNSGSAYNRNSFWLVKTSVNNTWQFTIYDNDSTQHIVSFVASPVIAAGTWYHIVATWNLKANEMAIYEAGTLKDDTGHGLSSDTVNAVGSLFQIGQYATTYNFNGVIAGRILNRPLTSTEVTALYASGVGHTDTFTVTPDTVWLGTYSDSDTDAVFQHRGQSVASITNSATESTIDFVGTQTVGSRSWKDNDRVVVWDGTGYKKEGLIDEASIATTDTTLDVDNGSGALVTDLEKVGVGATLNGTTQYFNGGDVFDLGTNDLSMSAWIKTTDTTGGYIVSKTIGAGLPFEWGIYLGTDGKIVVVFYSTNLTLTTVTGSFSTSSAVNDGKWHHIAVILDRSGNASLYIDGYQSGANIDISAAVADDMQSTTSFYVGNRSGGSTTTHFLDGSIRDVRIYIAAGANWSAANILTQAITPHNNAVGGTNTSSWYFDDAGTAANADADGMITDNTSTNHLDAVGGTTTTYGDHSRTQQAFISKNLIADSRQENGGIGGIVLYGTPTTIAKTSGNIYDEKALNIVTGTTASTYNGIKWTLDNYASKNVLLTFKHKLNSGDIPVFQYVLTGGYNITNVSLGSTSAVQEYEFATKLMPVPTNNSFALSKSYSSTNGSNFYIDNAQLLTNLVDNGSFDYRLDLKFDSNIFSNNTIGKTGAGWGVNAHTGREVYIAQNTGSGQYRDIASNTADTITTTVDWTTNPDATSDFMILDWVSGVAGSWTNQGSATAARSTSSRIATGYAQQVTGGSTSQNVKQDITVVSGKYYTVSGWLKRSSGTGNTTMELSGATTKTITHTTTTYTKYSHTFKAASTTLTIELYNDEGATVGLFDDISLIELDQDDPSVTGVTTPSTSANSFGTGKWSDASGAFLVDGGDTLTYPTSGNITATTGTISMWVKPQVLNTTRKLFSAYTSGTDYLTLGINSSNYPIADIDGAIVTGTTALSSVSTWYHLTMTWTNGGNLTLYVNASSQGTPVSYSSVTLPANLEIGSQNSGSQGDAFIDDVRIYSSALSSNDITAIYQSASQNLTAPINTNQWHFLSGVYSKSDHNLKIYLNGILRNTYDIGTSYDLGTSANSLLLGNGLAGYLDEPKVFNYARTASQIKADYTSNQTPKGASSKGASLGEQKNASEGLTGYWKMDESSGDAADSSGNSLTLTNNNSVSFAAGKYGNAADFTPASSHNFSTATSVSDVKTVEFWVYPDSDTNNYFDLASGVYLTSSSGTLTATGFTSPTIYVNGSRGEVISALQWSHIAVVTNTGVTASAIAFGKANSSYFDGKLDDIKIYNTARSAAQIMLDYETGPPPVAHWRMDEKVSGDAKTIYDSSGSNNGTTVDGANNTGMNCTKPGKYGSACQFDGVDDYVNLGQSASLNVSNITVSAWVKYDSDWTGSPTIAGRDDSTSRVWSFYRPNATTLRFFVFISDIAKIKDYTFMPTTGVWYHLVGIYDGSNVRIYVNGVDVGTPTAAVGNIDTDAVDTQIGDDLTTSHTPFKGLIDDVRIYNYARTQKQIMEDMNAGHPAVGSPVGSYVGYWNFDEGYGTTAYDKSNNSKDLTLSTASWTLNGKFGKAFDGGDNKRAADDADDNDLDFEAAENFTLSAWFNRGAISNAEYIVYKENGNEGYALYLDASGDVIFGIGDTNSASFPEESIGNLAVDYDNGAWHHAVAVKTGTSRIDLYVDGILIASDTSLIVDATLENAGIFYIGDANATDGADEFLGDIDEVKIYPFALSPAEIKQEYNGGVAIALGSRRGGVTPPPTWDDGGFGGSPPVAWWKMDEASWSGNGAVKSITGANNITHKGNAAIAAGGKYGRAGTFDGAGDYLCSDANSDGACDDDDDLDFGAGAFTISGWFKHTTASAQQNIIAKSQAGTNAGYKVYMASDGDIVFAVDDDSAWGPDASVTTTAATYDDNIWHYFAVVEASTASRAIYIDGNQIASNTTSLPDTLSNDDVFYVGVDDDGSSNPFNGQLDDIRVYNYARSQAQISWDYDRGKPFARWSMDSVGVGTSSPNISIKVYDESFRSNDGTFEGETPYNGTLTGAAWKQGNNCKYGSCLSFDGADDFVDVGTGPSSVKTVGFWVYPQTTTEYPVDLDGAAYIWLNAGAVTAQGFTSPTYYVNGSAGSTITAGSWQYITVTTDTAINASDLDLGRIEGVGNHEGRLDEVRFYNTALTAAQVLALYQNNDRAAGASLENNLAAEWHLDENSGSYTVDTHYLREGKRGYAIYLDGTDDYVGLGNDAKISNTLEGTWEGWFYAAAGETGGLIFDNRQFYVNWTSSMTLDIYTTAGWAQGTGGFSLGLGLSQQTWYHFAVVKTSDITANVYINGIYRTNITTKTGNLSVGSTCTYGGYKIGRHCTAMNINFKGLIDDIRIYNYARTVNQLKQDYNEGAAVRFGPASGLP